MKKVLALFLAVAIAAFGIAGCTKKVEPAPVASSSPSASEPAEKAEVNVAALNGPTGMGMVKLMKDSENGETENDYTFTLAGAPDEITGKLTSGEVDIAAIPTNLAATLYNKTSGQVQIAAINTLGVVCISFRQARKSAPFRIWRARKSTLPAREARPNMP